LVPSGTPVAFEQTARQIVVEPPPQEQCDPVANITVFEMEFEEPPVHIWCSAYPQLHAGEDMLK
jgi:hypothetical protein